ncbi:MAG: NAD(+)/NADH kinase [Candidatus Cloacimonadota bacterium]|nr:MAG: NAD(+)/NADH kinase [Candidatus Cloacimonadota bacterium]
MKSIGIVVNPVKPLAKKLLPETIEWLKKRKLEVFVVKEEKLDFIDSSLFIPPDALKVKSDFVIAMGGDGTLLRASRYIKESGIPLIGVNLGSLGFLTEIVVDELYPSLQRIIDGDYRIEKRIVLKATLTDSNSFFALNDIVLHMGHSGRIIEIEIVVDGCPLADFSADGLIISTPTGSTAYSLAAGGPILQPGVKAQILTPICPHRLGLRPMVFSSEEVISVKLKRGRGIFVVDGQMVIEAEENFTFCVTKADYEINLVRATKRDFYEILRTKLNWGGI